MPPVKVTLPLLLLPLLAGCVANGGDHREDDRVAVLAIVPDDRRRDFQAEWAAGGERAGCARVDDGFATAHASPVNSSMTPIPDQEVDEVQGCLRDRWSGAGGPAGVTPYHFRYRERDYVVGVDFI